MKALIHAIVLSIFCSASLAHAKQPKRPTLIESLCIGAIVAIAGYGAWHYCKKQKKKQEQIKTASLLQRIDDFHKGDAHLSYIHIEAALCNGANPNKAVQNSLPRHINDVLPAQLAIENKLPIKTIKLFILHGAQFSQRDVDRAREHHDADHAREHDMEGVATLLERHLASPNEVREAIEKELGTYNNKSSASSTGQTIESLLKSSTDSSLIPITPTTSSDSGSYDDSPTSQSALMHREDPFS